MLQNIFEKKSFAQIPSFRRNPTVDLLIVRKQKPLFCSSCVWFNMIYMIAMSSIFYDIFYSWSEWKSPKIVVSFVKNQLTIFGQRILLLMNMPHFTHMCFGFLRAMNHQSKYSEFGFVSLLIVSFIKNVMFIFHEMNEKKNKRVYLLFFTQLLLEIMNSEINILTQLCHV